MATYRVNRDLAHVLRAAGFRVSFDPTIKEPTRHFRVNLGKYRGKDTKPLVEAICAATMIRINGKSSLSLGPEVPTRLSFILDEFNPYEQV